MAGACCGKIPIGIEFERREEDSDISTGLIEHVAELAQQTTAQRTSLMANDASATTDLASNTSRLVLLADKDTLSLKCSAVLTVMRCEQASQPDGNHFSKREASAAGETELDSAKQQQS